ncbi:MAG TPA: PEP-CTERM sorting domain-containing protein [Armatimonadota bacterium]|nr:PEP-CTERM sorting domain-containing protein [Armatimonadota bacterium]
MWFLPRLVGVATVVVLGMAWANRPADSVSATVIAPQTMQRQFSEVVVERVGGEDGGVARRVYPMSVIPGGAFTVEELKSYLDTDEIARQSFEDHAKRIGDPELLDHLQVALVPEPVTMYTMLRDGAKLFISSEPVTVERGESMFYHEDTGDEVARARCGNVMVTVQPKGYVPMPAPVVSSGYIAPAPVAQPIPQPPQAVDVLPAGGARAPQIPFFSPPVAVPPAPAPVVMPTAVPPTIVIPPTPAAAAAAAPPPMIVPIMPPPSGSGLGGFVRQKSGGSGGLGLLAAGLAGGLGGGGGSKISVVQQQKQGQGQQQGQKQKLKDCPEPIPEPATMLLMGLGLGATGVLARRKRKK